MGEVYFAHAPDAGVVKIGWTQGHSAYRVSVIQTASPVPLRLLGAIAGSRRDEQTLHERFADARAHGEWFADSIVPDLREILHTQRRPSRKETTVYYPTRRDRNAEITRLHGEGWSQPTLALRFGLSQSCISKVIAKHHRAA